ncbi:hypothetical protein EHQ58_06000 [Leptospira ognonensis]|uniref:Uncharacterized protein n=1 Tax=Leptospira ognonensis TaxID=2484945 RepID=A0A4R9K497_9LEPT|nr:hypothetical protein [Leptospira ognonensis]TGL60050.1 hypothetical protein EHQ58_06000 [Leptospira ognonensis]
MESQWKRFWETGLFPFLEFALSLSLGYFLSLLFFIASSELNLVDTSDSAFPILQGLLILFFGIGFIFRKYSQAIPVPLTVALIFALALEIFWFQRQGSSDFLIDYIFSFELILVGAVLCAFVTGLYCGSIKDYRFLSFALGITLFTFHSLFDPTHNSSLKSILIIIFLLLESYLLSTFLNKSAFSLRFYKIRSKIGKHPLFAPFYRSALSLLLAYCTLHLYFQPGPKIPLILSISFAVFFGRILSLVTGIKKETKAIYLIGRIMLVVSFFFFIYQSYWNYFYIALCIILAGMVGFFKPNETKQKEYVFVAMETSAYVVISLLLYHWNIMVSIRSIVAILFAPILTYPYLLQKHIVRYPQLIMLLISSLTAFIFFYPPSIRTNVPFSKKEIYDPIPYQISNLEESANAYVYYGSILPFKSNPFLPKKAEIKDKTVILGLKNHQSQVISYIERLSKEKHQFLIFIARKKTNVSPHISALSLLRRTNFWGFDVYYPPYMADPIQFTSQLPKDWKFKYFQERLENASLDESRAVLDSIIKFSGVDLRKDSLLIKHLYYASYASYAKYYYEIGQNKLALDAIAIARKFEPPDKDLLKIAFNSLKYTTPEPDFIPILEDLSNEIEFQEFAWNTLLPMFESLGDWNNALKTMEQLEKFYKFHNLQLLSSELELVKVRLYLNQENWKDAEPLILTRAKENPQSVIWDRLKNEVAEKKESSKRIYARPEQREARIQ